MQFVYLFCCFLFIFVKCDDYLDVTVSFDSTISWDSCNIVSVTIISTGETISMKIVNYEIIAYDKLEETNPSDSGQRSCLYQQININASQIIALAVHNGTLNGFISFEEINYHANEIFILQQFQQTIRFLLTNKTNEEEDKYEIFSKQGKYERLVTIDRNQNYAMLEDEELFATQNYYVELYLVADQNFFYLHQENSVNRLYEIMNYVNAVYRTQGIHIIIVGLEVWYDYNRIPIKEDSYEQIDLLTQWRSTLTKRHDNLHMINGYRYLDKIIGLAYVSSMCRFFSSLGISSDATPKDAIRTAMTIAHEIGHNLGILHDDASCSCSESSCLMSPRASNKSNPLKWSNCSIISLHSNLASGSSSYCLKNIPQMIKSRFFKPICGNGIIEEGEECESTTEDGKSNCCNTTTCMLLPNALCDSGPCCNPTTCQFHPLGTTCRNVKDECDLIETCTGAENNCPTDKYKDNGVLCDNNQGTCFDGRCGSHNLQCKMLYGPSSTSAVDECYQLNSNKNSSFETGYCDYEYMKHDDILPFYKTKECKSDDYLCGALHCMGSSIPQWHMIQIYGGNYTYAISNDIKCFHVNIDTNPSGQRDPGLVPNGARCGKSKICVNSHCIEIDDTIGKTTETISSVKLSSPKQSQTSEFLNLLKEWNEILQWIVLIILTTWAVFSIFSKFCCWVSSHLKNEETVLPTMTSVKTNVYGFDKK